MCLSLPNSNRRFPRRNQAHVCGGLGAAKITNACMCMCVYIPLYMYILTYIYEMGQGWQEYTLGPVPGLPGTGTQHMATWGFCELASAASCTSPRLLISRPCRNSYLPGQLCRWELWYLISASFPENPPQLESSNYSGTEPEIFNSFTLQVSWGLIFPNAPVPDCQHLKAPFPRTGMLLLCPLERGGSGLWIKKFNLRVSPNCEIFPEHVSGCG